jgi:hypothetical protein
MERAVLTFSPVKTLFRIRPARIGAALALSALALGVARADTLWVGGCTGGHGAGNCVLLKSSGGDPHIRTVPEPQSDADKERAAERDRKWLERCQPVIAQDHYGVPRYEYAARGCEFGVIE